MALDSISSDCLPEEDVILDDSWSECSLSWPDVVVFDVAGDEEYPVEYFPDDPFGMEEEAAGSDLSSYDEDSGCSQADPIGFLPSDPFEMEAAASQGCRNGIDSSFFEDCGVDSCEEGSTSRFSMCESHGESSTVVSGCEELPSNEEEGFPHYGIFLSIDYLRVQDLLAVEMVCRSLRYAVQNKFALSKCIHIGSPLSERLTDDALHQLTRKVQGMLQCLSLVGCSMITDDGLKRVLEGNPRLMKLSLPGCVRLTIGGLINNLSILKASGTMCLKQLRLGRLFKVTKEHYEELNAILDVKQLQKAKSWKPQFYYNTMSSQNCDDERPIDIEICPVCQKLKLVFDCPAVGCQGDTPDKCRACDMCIPRCVHCGRCIKDRKFMETFFLDYLCSSCWKQPIQCQVMMEEDG